MTRTAEYVSALCCLKAAEAIWNQEMWSVERQLNQAQPSGKPKCPEEPQSTGLYKLLYLPMIVPPIVGVIILIWLVKVFLKSWFGGLVVSIGAVPLSLFMFGASVALYDYISQRSESDRKHEEEYKRALDTYNKKLAAWEKKAASIPALENRLKILNEDLARIERRIELVSIKNIVPSQYRDVNALMFLQKWFTSCQSEDMGLAVRMYELERSERSYLFGPMYNIDDYISRYNDLKNISAEDTASFLETLQYF